MSTDKEMATRGTTAKPSASAQPSEGTPRKGPKNIAQDRARWAWDQVEKMVKQPEEMRKKYGALACKLPSYLQTSGLGQTLAFLYAHQGTPKDNKPHRFLLEHLQNYLGDQFPGKRSLQAMQIVLGFTPVEYRRATREVEAAAQWLKRFAQGRLDPDMEG